MKKLYVLLLVSSLIKPVLGQPTFTQADFIQIGEAVTTYPLDPTGIVEGNSGANQTWNFSTAVTTGAGVTATALAPASTPFASMFPSSTIALKTVSSGGNDAYGYYNVTANHVDLIGAGTHSPTMDIMFNYSDPLRAATFPFTYNSAIQDNYVALASYVAGGLQVNDYRRGTISILADAYGSVTTPDATYPSSLRLIQTETVVDSIIITGFPAATMVTAHHTSYSWTPANMFNSVFSILYDTTDQGTGPVPSFSVTYSSAVTGINENYSLRALEVYPNPAVKSSQVNFVSDELESGSTTFRATDLNGRVVKQFDFMMYSANHKSVSVDMSDCGAGMYYIQLIQKGKIFSTKFIMN